MPTICQGPTAADISATDIGLVWISDRAEDASRLGYFLRGGCEGRISMRLARDLAGNL